MIERQIIDRVLELDEFPLRDRPERWLSNESPYPFPRNRLMFPSVASARASALASYFKRAVREPGGSKQSLRLITLRFGNAKPEVNELDYHLKMISECVNAAVNYAVKKRLAQPQLSVFQTRFDQATGRLDPHLHGTWAIPQPCIAELKELLKR